jgi:outer membrane protein assembly factor BamE
MRYTILLLTLLCAACSSALPTFKPYRMDIQQGNIVTSKMLMQLKPGMSKSQARFVMGTPLLQDSFHGDRWDYFYQYRKDGKIVQQRRVILEFENEQLKRVRGDTIPAGVDPTVPELQRRSVEKEKGLWDRLKFWKSDEASAAAAGATAATASAVAETPSSKDALDPMLVNPPASSPARPADVSDPAEPVAPAVVQDAPAAAPAPSKPAASAPAPAKATPAKPAAATSSATPSAPAAKAAPAKAAPAAATQAAPEDDLPPEEEPGYFERMLEKIGF